MAKGNSKIQGVKRKLASQAPKSSKKAKLAPLKASTSKAKAKDKAFQRPTVPIPKGLDEEDIELSDQDLELLDEHGDAADFLTTLDHGAIARSKAVLDRQHRLTKPVAPKQPRNERLSLSESDDGSVGFSNSDFEDEDENENVSLSEPEDDDLSLSDADEDEDEVPSVSNSDEPDSDKEMDYETRPRKLHSTRAQAALDEEKITVPRLPIKLPDGTIQPTGKRRIEKVEKVDAEAEMIKRLSRPSTSSANQPVIEDVSTGARFGRPAVVDVISISSRNVRIQAAKEQLSSICQDIISDPENNLGLLRRLNTFSLASITTPSHPEPVKNDPFIRKLAILSQTAVFKDIIPGYRIRKLTDHEKAEKVTQAVMRTREFEQGLVSAYQTFLANIDGEIKAKSEDLAECCLRSMCTMLLECTHFNFRSNLLSTIVTQISRKSWTPTSQLCSSTLITLFKRDNEGEPSLEAVRFLNRMVKERKYAVHPNVLNCLLHLRLKSELGVRASQIRADRAEKKVGAKEEMAKKIRRRLERKQHISKKAKKVLKESKAIQNEMKEADAHIDQEERTSRHTETLKLVFVLYFSILKSPEPLSTPKLVEAALQGVAKFAHLVNVDFFRDLVGVLRGIIVSCRTIMGGADGEAGVGVGVGERPKVVTVTARSQILRLQLLCIVTAFELLSGQGEALNIDLDEFVNDLYALILPLSLDTNLEKEEQQATAGGDAVRTPDDIMTPSAKSTDASLSSAASLATLLFQALDHLFSQQGSGSSPAHVPVSRAAAFASRLLIAAPHFPAPTSARTLRFVHSALLSRFPALDALLSSEDRAVDGGVYRAELDDVQVCHPFGTCWFSLFLLRTHVDPVVRKEALKVASFSR